MNDNNLLNYHLVDDPAWQRLIDILRGLAKNKQFAIAYSGGLDSRFLAHTSQLAGLHPILLHASGRHIPRTESDWARNWAKQRGMNLTIFQTDVLTVPEVAAGLKTRCYYCKRTLFGMLIKHIGTLAPQGALILCDGANASDQHGYRPGMKAVEEYGVRSPLLEAGLGKAEIHDLARRTGMERPEQHPHPCLLTRYAYDLHPTSASMQLLEAAEEAVTETLLQELHTQNPDSLPDFRLRVPEIHRLQLHLQGNISPKIQKALISALARINGLPAPEILCMKEVSGFYDRQQTVENVAISE